MYGKGVIHRMNYLFFSISLIFNVHTSQSDVSTEQLQPLILLGKNVLQNNLRTPLETMMSVEE